jgi:hypothetical protein
MNRDRKATGLIALAIGLALLWAAPATAAITAPIISSTAVTPLTPTSARLEATINPGERPVKPYFFEYVSQAGFEEGGYASASRTPEATIPNGKAGVPVSAQVGGLIPHTTYHFRAYAKNTKGESFGPDTLFTTFSSPQPFGPCPNDALRSGQPSAALPDCRAYEQASPVDKNGGDVTGTVSYAKTSPDGNRVSFLATSPIPGAEGAAELFPPYLASRGPGGWSTQGLFPPQREGQYAFVDSWTPDFSTTYSWARRVVERNGIGEPFQTTLLARSSDGEGLQTIVPHTQGFSTPTVPGTSEDGSVVFFEFLGNPGPLTPDAPKERPNLYVWDRDSGVYQLAGVMNDGKAPPAGSFAGPYEWLAGNLNLGGANRRYDTRDQHAIAPDGSSVYFTAAKTGQLYLRLNPTAEQSAVVNPGEPDEECTEPAKACTIHVSASHKDNGEGPNGTDSAGPQPAAFLGATPDGSQAYFMSSEKLTNDANTGPEQPPAQIGRAKIGETEAEEVQPGFLPRHALALATSPDGRYLYWVDPSKGTIARADLEASEPEKTIEDEFIVPGPVDYEVEPGVTESVPSTPRYVAVGPCAEGGECVYWTNTGRIETSTGLPKDGTGTIGRAALNAGGLPEDEKTKPDFIRGASNPEGIAVNTEHLYWANAPLGGIGVRSIARAAIGGEAGSVEEQFFEMHNEAPRGVAVSSTHVYFSSNVEVNDFGFINRITLGGEEKESLFIGKAGIRGVAVDANEVYWATQGEEAVGRIPVVDFPPSGACVSIPTCDIAFAKPGGAVFGVGSDGNHIYWSTNAEAGTNPGKDLYRFDASSGALTDLAPDPTGNGAEVQGILGSSDDGSFVYFAANGVFGSAPSVGDCHLGSGETYDGSCNLYVDHEGRISFISRLNTQGRGGGDALNWWPESDDLLGLFLRASRVSPNGRTLLFRSAEKLTSYENAGTPEFYRYSYGEPGSIVCVTCNPTGVPPLKTGEGPNLGNITAGEGLAQLSAASALSRNLSADGNRVFFETLEALVPADVNGREGCPVNAVGIRSCQDVYEWEADGSGTCESTDQNGGCVYLLSSGTSPDPSFFADASVHGDSAFIFTRQPLVPQDEDSFQDVYDVRVGGGLPSQNQPPPPVPCEGEACKGAAAASPALASPATTNVSESGNQKPGPVKCGKGKHKVKRHGKTVCAKNTKKPKKHNKTNKHGRTH